jgi:hypothetical protein
MHFSISFSSVSASPCTVVVEVSAIHSAVRHRLPLLLLLLILVYGERARDSDGGMKQ